MAVGIMLFSLAGLAGLVTLLAFAISKVREGKGFETYRTVWLVDFSYVGVLVLFGGVVAAFLLGAAMWWREERQWRALERKYESRGKQRVARK